MRIKIMVTGTVLLWPCFGDGQPRHGAHVPKCAEARPTSAAPGGPERVKYILGRVEDRCRLGPSYVTAVTVMMVRRLLPRAAGQVPRSGWPGPAAGAADARREGVAARLAGSHGLEHSESYQDAARAD